MKVYTKRDAIKSGIQCFIQTWGSSPRGTYGADYRSINVCQELQKLDPETVDVKIVNDLIGNPYWTQNKCDECQQDSEAVVFLGDYDSASRLCPKCLQGASNLISLSGEVSYVTRNGI